MQAAPPRGGEKGIDLHLAMVRVIEVLKKSKRGLTLDEIQAKTNLQVRGNSALLDYLFSSEHLQYDGIVLSFLLLPE